MTYISKLPNGKLVVERHGKQWTMTVRVEYVELSSKE